MKKTRLILLTTLSAMLLASCSLFNDDDIKVTNSFNRPSTQSSKGTPEATVNGVDSIRIDGVGNTLVFKNIGYATNEKIVNTYKDGGANDIEYNVNQGQDYSATTSSNNYDLYVPDYLDKTIEQTVVLFIHGGAWISGYKTDVNPYVQELARKGYIGATLKYTLLKKEMDDASLSIFRDLDEIDACISSIKSSLKQLGFDENKLSLVIGGASSGAHLAMLYSYSRGDASALPIKFVVDAVGPTDIKTKAWKAFVNASEGVLDLGITYSAIEAQKSASNLKALEVSGEGYNWNEYQTMRIANGMCGMPYTLTEVEAATDSNKENITNPSNPAYVSMSKNGGGEDLLSVTYHIPTSEKYPILCAYSGKDSVVGIAQYANLEKCLIDNSVEHEFFYFKNCGHTNLAEDETTYSAFISKIDDWCKNK